MAALTVVNGENTKPFARVSRPPPRPQEVELILQRSYPPSFPRITSTTTMPYSAEQYVPYVYNRESRYPFFPVTFLCKKSIR